MFKISFIEKIKEKKRLKEELRIKKLKILKEQYKKFKDEVHKEFSDDYDKEQKKRRDADDKCPECGSTNVNDRIKREQGNISGSSHGGYTRGLFWGFGEYEGSINGKWDTNPVNKCNDCKHEWKKYKVRYNHTTDIRENRLNIVEWYLKKLYKINHVKFDPDDMTEEYNSKEEKIIGLKKELEKSYYIPRIKRNWSDYSIDLITYLVNKEFSTYQKEDFFKYFNKKSLKDLGLKTISDILEEQDDKSK